MRTRTRFFEPLALMLAGGAVALAVGCDTTGDASRKPASSREVAPVQASVPATPPIEVPVATEPVVATDPRHAYLDGIAAWKEGRPEQAERDLLLAADYDPTHVKTFVNLARVRMDRGDFAGALEAAEKGLALDANSSQVMHQQGRALAALGRWDEALDTLNEAYEAEPENGYIANTLGWALIQKGRFTDAVGILEGARESLPDIAYVRNNLGVAYERAGRLDEAVAEFRAAVARGDSGGKAGMSLARLGVPEIDTAVAESVPVPAPGEAAVIAEHP